MKAQTLRKTWPKIRTAKIKGVWFYQVDTRREINGKQHGKREAFVATGRGLEDAKKRAEEVAAEHAANGTEGLAMPAELRVMAFQGEKILAPFGKTILQAAEFYRAHLTSQKEKEESALVSKLADEWLTDKKRPQHKLKPPTIKGIRQTANLLKKEFPDTRIKTVTKADAEKFIFSLNGEYQQEGTRNRSSQFFNWCIAKEHATANPFSSKVLAVALPQTDVQIFTAEKTKEILELCEQKHRDILVYAAICFFAGLRPGEAELLTWENIHLGERQIHVLGTTSKSGVTHNVDIEKNLAGWLKEYRPKNAKGFICPQGTTLARRRQALHAALGFKAAGQNPDAEEIVQDVMRHSYASHWQAKYANVHKLAEMMANSVEVIRAHYKKVVSKAELKAYWSIFPQSFVKS